MTRTIVNPVTSSNISSAVIRNELQILENEISNKTVITVGFDDGCDYICDGTADDVQIQEAVNAMAALGGGIIKFARGIFWLDSTIVLPKDPSIRFVGEKMTNTSTGGTTIKANSTLTNMFEMEGTSNPAANSDLSHDLQFEHIVINGNLKTTNNFYLKNVDSAKFIFCRIISATNSITTAWDSTVDPVSATIPGGIFIDNCIISANSGIGIDLQYQTQCWISNSWFTGTSVTDWIVFKCSNKIHVSNCEFNTALRGMNFQDTATFPCHNITVNNCVFSVGSSNKAWTDSRVNAGSYRISITGFTLAILCSYDQLVGTTNVISGTIGVQSPDGALTAVGHGFASDQDTGMYRISEDTLGIAAGGALKMQIDESGSIDMKTQKLINVVDPVSDQDASTKKYSDTKVSKSTYDANSILYATTDDTPVALTVGEQTIVGRATGGAISALSIDSDLASVSANDDTIPSAKAVKAVTDARVPYSGATGDVDLNNKNLSNISKLGIGQSVPPNISCRVIGDNGSLSRISMRGYSNDADASEIRVAKFRGTYGTPLVPQSGDSLGKFQFCGYSGTSSDGVAGSFIQGVATELWSTIANGAKLLFKVTPNGTASRVTALTIDQDNTATFAGAVSASNLSSTNTGDETTSTIKTKLGAATASVDGYATATQITKLDGIEAGADVTDAANVSSAGAFMASGIKVVRKSADETVNNSDTLQDDDSLLFAVGASEIWAFEIYARVSYKLASDFKFTFTVPSGATGGYKMISDSNFTANERAFASVVSPVSTSDQSPAIVCKGIVINSTNAGNLTFQWAQNTATAEDTKVLANSYIIAHKLS